MCDGVFYVVRVEECLLRLLSNKRPMWGLTNPLFYPFFLKMQSDNYLSQQPSETAKARTLEWFDNSRRLPPARRACAVLSGKGCF